MAEAINNVESFICRKCIKQLPIKEMSSHKNLCRECRSEEQRAYRRRKAEERHRRDDLEEKPIADAAEKSRLRMTVVEAKGVFDHNDTFSGHREEIRCPGPTGMLRYGERTIYLEEWLRELFVGYENLHDRLLKDADECFRDPRMQVLWILHQHYLCSCPSDAE